MAISFPRRLVFPFVLISVNFSLASSGIQLAGPVQIHQPDSRVNATLYKPHLTRVKQTVTHEGKEISTTSFTNDMRLTQAEGNSAFHIVTKGEGWDLDLLFSQRSFMLLRYDMRLSNGGFMQFQMNGARVTGKLKESKGEEKALDHELETPAIPAGIVDAIVGALPLTIGYAAKIAVFQPGQPAVEWKTYRVTGTQSVIVNGKKLEAWVVDEQGRVNGTMWLLDEPPYMVRWVMRFPNGRELRMEQELLKVH